MAAILKDVGFVHLHVHSSYSLLEGALPIAKLVKLAEADQQPALALTDTNNLFGALEFSEKAAGSGIQPIAGIQLSVDFADRPDARVKTGAMPESRGNLVLLAASEKGYENLLWLSSHAFLDTPTSEDTHLPFARFEGRTEGVIALTGGPVRRPAVRRDPASRPGGRAADRAVADRFGRRGRGSACGGGGAVLRQARGFRGA